MTLFLLVDSKPKKPAKKTTKSRPKGRTKKIKTAKPKSAVTRTRKKDGNYF